MLSAPAESADGSPLVATSRSLNLTDFMRILKHQTPLIGLVSLLALALAFAYIAMTPSRYTASTNILINPQPKRVFSNEYVPQDGNTNQLLIESQTRVIASSAVLLRVVDSERLADDSEFNGNAGGGIVDLLKDLTGLGSRPALPARQAARRDEALRRLTDQLAVKRPSQTYVVEVSVSARSPEKATRLANAVAEAYIADQAETQADDSRKTAQALQDRLATLRQRVLDADNRIQEFKQRHDIVASEGALLNERELSRLGDELQAARTKVTDAEAKVARVRGFLATGDVPESFDEAVNSRLVGSLREQYARSARRESQLASVYGARHPQLIAARAEVARTRGLIQAELGRLVDTLKNELAIDQQRVTEIEKRMHTSRDVTDTTNMARVELASLEQEANAARAVYERVLTKARESSAEEKIDTFDARIISYATTPLWASWPKKSIILPLALLLGLGLGIAGALVNDYRQDRFGAPEDIERDTGLRLLASIPSLEPQPKPGLLRRLGHRQESPADAARNSYFRLYQELATVGSPYATAVMGFVRQLQPAGSRHASQSVMLVSSGPQEGASSLAWSTAIVAAMQHRRVLLIDGDGGTGELSKTLAPNAGARLRDVLKGAARFSDLLIKDAELGISFLPLVATDATGSGPNWGDYQTLLARLPAMYSEYDLIVVDGGALSKSGLAHLLVDLVDEVVLVAKSDETRRADLIEAQQALSLGERRPLGVVASMVDPRRI